MRSAILAIRSLKPSCLPAPGNRNLLLIVCFALACLGAGGEANRVRVILCSDEPAHTLKSFSSSIGGYLTFAEVEVRATCPVPDEAGGFVARFVGGSGESRRLLVETQGTHARTRELGWVQSGLPLESTMSGSQVPALALILEGLLLEFESVQLMHAPGLPEPSGELPPEPAEGGPSTLDAGISDLEPPDPAQPEARPGNAGGQSAHRAPSTPQLPVAKETPMLASGAANSTRTARQRRGGTSRPRSAGRQASARPARAQRAMGLQFGAGVSLLPGNTWAPVVALSGAYETATWGAVLALRQSFDSSFAIEGRSFKTFTTMLAAGARAGFLEQGPFWMGADGYLLGLLSSYERDHLPNTSARRWVDLGVGAEATARWHLAPALWVYGSGGLQVIPTAREAQIKDGPRRSTGYLRVPVLGGIACFF